MDAVLFGRYFLEFALLYPGAYLCLAPLRDHLKAPKTTYWIAGGALTALCLGCAALCTIFELPSNVFLLPILIVSFRLLRWRTEGVTVSQTAFLFSISAVMLAVCSLLAVVLNARAETGNQQEANLVSTALLALTQDDVSAMEPSPCINCGRCVEACPGRIVPSLLATYAEHFDEEAFVEHNGMECCECGCCSFVCPAKRPLTQEIKSMRKIQLAKKKKK